MLFLLVARFQGLRVRPRTIEKGVSKVAQVYSANKGLWVMDRGFDSILIFSFSFCF
jgi:hypothetical protein